jgi:hypothetical protein
MRDVKRLILRVSSIWLPTAAKDFDELVTAVEQFGWKGQAAFFMACVLRSYGIMATQAHGMFCDALRRLH